MYKFYWNEKDNCWEKRIDIDTVKNCLITIFVGLVLILFVANVMLVRENKLLKNEIEIYQGIPDYNQFQD